VAPCSWNARDDYVPIRVEPLSNAISKGWGSATLVEYLSRTVVVTNWHVLSNRKAGSGEWIGTEVKPNKLNLHWHDGTVESMWLCRPTPPDRTLRPIWESLIDDEPGADLAAFVVDSKPSQEHTFKMLEQLEEPVVGLQVEVQGFPAGSQARRVVPGVITRLRGEELCFDVDAAGTASGMSGGPVVSTSSGKLVGVYAGRPETGCLVFGPAAIRRLLDRLVRRCPPGCP
jgi:hypothetical protein